MTINVRLFYQVGFSKAAVDQLVELENRLLNALITAEGSGHQWISDTLGAFTAGNPVEDIVVTFKREGVAIATRTIRGTLTSAAGTVAIADNANTGEDCTVALTGSGTSAAQATVTHTLSGVTGRAGFTAADISSAVSLPIWGD